MKEIIYLDTDLMNSMLAQLDEGLIQNFSLEQGAQESETEGNQSTRSKNAGFKGSVNASTGLLPGGGLRLDASLGNNGSEGSNHSRTILESQKDILNKAFHDYALDRLTYKLTEGDYLVDGPDFKEGDLHLGEDTFKFFDFELLKNVIDHKSLQEIMLFTENSPISGLTEALEIIGRKRKGKLTSRDQNKLGYAELIDENYENLLPIINLFKVLETFSTYSEKAFGNSSVIKIGNKIGFLKKNYLRDSSVTLSFRTDKSRNVKFLVRIIGVKDVVYNESKMPNLGVGNLDQIPNLIFDVLLGSFEVIKEGDVLVTPIAIYYE